MDKLNLFRDTLTEMCNIGASRATVKLSKILEDNIKLTVPNVATTTFAELPLYFYNTPFETISCLYGQFDGKIRGQALLTFEPLYNKVILEAFTKKIFPSEIASKKIDENDVMVELGNIIISTTISAIADIIKEPMSLSVPKYTQTTLDDLLIHSSKKYLGENGDTTAVAAVSMFRAANCNAMGTIAIVFALETLDVIISKFLQSDAREPI